MFRPIRTSSMLALFVASTLTGCVLEAGLTLDGENDVDAAPLPPTETACDDGSDDDGDSFTDCNDSDCVGVGSCPSAQESNCSDGNDDDDDGFTDCDDGDCADDIACTPREANCQDGLDNDDDGFTDCDDSDCDGMDCTPTAETACDDDLDDDDDGAIDCFDSDCDGTAACTDTVLSVFITSRQYGSDFVGVGSGGGGTPTPVQRADNICNFHATEAGMSGEFVAWVGSSTRDPITLLTSNGPWLRPDGTTVFQTRTGSKASPMTYPDAKINVDETGTVRTGIVWTGTEVGGTAVSPSGTCSDWTSTMANAGQVGDTEYIDHRWTGGEAGSSHVYTGCTAAARIYCIER